MSSDTVQLEGYVGGGSLLSDGIVTTRPRMGNFGELMTSRLNASFYEHVLRGQAFVYSTPAVGAALVAPTTTNAPMLWNPSGSGKNLVLHKVEFGYTGTTWAAGHIEYGVITGAGSQIGTGAPIVSLTQVAGVNCLLGAGNASVMRFAPTTVVVVAAPTFLCTAGISSNAGTAAAVVPPFKMEDVIDGHIVVPPGVAFFVMANAAIAGVVCVSIYGVEVAVAPTA
jgi:hypothetical protein